MVTPSTTPHGWRRGGRWSLHAALGILGGAAVWCAVEWRADWRPLASVAFLAVTGAVCSARLPLSMQSRRLIVGITAGLSASGGLALSSFALGALLGAAVYLSTFWFVLVLSIPPAR